MTTIQSKYIHYQKFTNLRELINYMKPIIEQNDGNEFKIIDLYSTLINNYELLVHEKLIDTLKLKAIEFYKIKEEQVFKDFIDLSS